MYKVFKSLAIASTLMLNFNFLEPALADVKIHDYQTGRDDCISADNIIIIARTIAAKTNVPISLIVLPRDTLVQSPGARQTPQGEMYRRLILAMNTIMTHGRVPLIITCGDRNQWEFTNPDWRTWEWRARPVPDMEGVKLFVPHGSSVDIPF